MKDYKGFEFTTNKGIKCIIIEDNFNKKYVVVDIDNFRIVASDNYNVIENLITIVKRKF